MSVVQSSVLFTTHDVYFTSHDIGNPLNDLNLKHFKRILHPIHVPIQLSFYLIVHQYISYNLL